MNGYWITEKGDKIPYNKLEDSHLSNILKFIKRRAKKGIRIIIGDMGYSGEEMWGDSWFEYGDKVLDRFDYKGLLKEAKKRKLT